MPERLRVLGVLDMGLLGNLGVSLLVVVAGAALVPALSLPDALLAILLGCVLGNLMLAVAGAIGADARVPGMAHAGAARAARLVPPDRDQVSGRRLDDVRAAIIATAAAALSDELFGFRAQWLWTIVFGVAALVLALLGPIGFVAGSSAGSRCGPCRSRSYLTWWALDGADLRALWDTPGEGGLSVWQGADFVVGITVSWIPYAADYTRFSKTRRGAFVGTGLGYLVPTAGCSASASSSCSRATSTDPAGLPDAVVAGGLAAILALFALLVTETDEAFANASAAVSLQNLVPRASQPLLIGLVTATATAGAPSSTSSSYQSFLFLLGSVFVPLLRSARRLARGRRHYSADDVFEAPPGGPASSPRGSAASRSTSG